MNEHSGLVLVVRAPAARRQLLRRARIDPPPWLTSDERSPGARKARGTGPVRSVPGRVHGVHRGWEEVVRSRAASQARVSIT